ncbi:MAG: LysM peptidoglycan-binding domain-containing protein [Butyricicoccus sp.]
MTIHVVQPGDTVYTIARQYDVPMQRIITDNELHEPARLTPGQTLVIQFPRRVYTVQPGDTLSSIAAKSGTTIYQLWQNNPQLGGMGDIVPGQQLVISYEGAKKGAFAVNGYAYPNIDPSILRKTLPYLTYLSVFSFGVQPDGSIMYIDDKNLPETAREVGVVPLMVLTTLAPDGTFSGERASELLHDPAAQQRLVQELLSYMEQRGYGGVDVDFEYIPAVDRNLYADFIAMLRSELSPHGYIVMVALAPKTSAEQRGLLYEAHDYAQLGNAADYSLIMTYEWGYSRSAPMAVAPINKVRQVVQYAASVIPPDRIFMGIPNYGYDWTLPFVQGESVARSLGNVQAVEQAVNEGAAIEFDQTAQSPFYNYYRDQKQHEVWFEDARSIQSKLALARDFGLRGVSVWNIMRYFPQLWLVLNGEYAIQKAR